MKLRVNNEFYPHMVLLVCFFVFYFFIVFADADCKNITLVMELQFLFIGMFSFYSIIGDSNPYSLNKMHWYFIFVFMFLVPFSHLFDNYWPWEYRVGVNTMEMANNLIILWICIYYIFYKRGSKLKQSIYKNVFKLSCVESNFLVCASIIATILLVDMVGFRNLFIRGVAMNYSSILEYVGLYFLRAVPVISSAILLRCSRVQSNISKINIMVCLLLSLIINSPVALSRYWTAVVYLGLLVNLLPLWFWNFRSFDIMFFVAMMFVFPVMKLFKWHSLEEIMNMNIDFSYGSLFYGGDFDAYSMLCRIVEYVQMFGVKWGEQVKSVIFFFVPRNLWDVKGEPTGSLVSLAQGASYTNLSAPLMGEGYIDFGIIGVIIYAILFSKLLSYLDVCYWNNRKNFSVGYVDFIMPFFMGFVVFLMRGAFQPIIIRIMGFFLFLIIIYSLKSLINLVLTRKIV